MVKPPSNDMKLNIGFNQPMDIPIDENGKLKGEFTNNMKVMIISASDSSIKEGSSSPNGSKRKLQRRKSSSGEESGADLLSFGWYVSSWSQENIEIELRLENPEAVSSQGGYDLIALQMGNIKIKSNVTGEVIDLGSIKTSDCYGHQTTFCKPIPPIVADQA